MNQKATTQKTTATATSGHNSRRVTTSGEVRSTCPCYGGDTKRITGYCGRCLL